MHVKRCAPDLPGPQEEGNASISTQMVGMSERNGVPGRADEEPVELDDDELDGISGGTDAPATPPQKPDGGTRGPTWGGFDFN
jgi:hypothetical protein